MPKSIRLPATSSEGPQTGQTQSPPFLPTLDDEEILRDVVCKLSKSVAGLSPHQRPLDMFFLF